MNVLIVTHHALPHVGGVEVVADAEASELAARGHSVVWLASDAAGAGPAPTSHTNIRHVRVRSWHVVEGWLKLAYPIPLPGVLPTLWKEVRRADVVHAHGFIYPTSVLALLIAWLQRKPRMLTDHGAIQRYHSPVATVLMFVAAQTLGRLSCVAATRVMAQNLRVLNVLERFSFGKTRARLVPFAVDRSVFSPVSAAERLALRARLGWGERPVVLFVGRVRNPDKGATLLIEAKDPSFDVVLCGPGDASDLGTSETEGICFLGPQPHSVVRDLYRAADVVAVPTTPGREGFPLVVHEALACGVPVVLSYEPGYEPYRALKGLHFSDHNVAALREAIGRAVGYPTPIVQDADCVLTPTREEWIAAIYDGTPV